VVAHGRIPQLDGLRAVAILAVFFNHTLHIPLTWVGVDVFFVLSGFLITGILLRRKSAGGGYFSYFYRRRVFRILPPYALTIVLYGLIFTWTAFQPWPIFAFFGMNLQPYFYRGWLPVQLPLWSLAVEEQFYLVWPVVILLVSEKVLLRLAVAAVVFTPMLRFVCTPLFSNMFSIYVLTPFRADLLCAGAALAILWSKRSARFEGLCRGRAWLGVVAGFGALALVQMWPLFRLASNTRWANGLDYSLSLVGSVCLLAWALAGRGWFYRALVLKPMRYLGQISYTVYLVHLAVVYWFEVRMHSRIAVTVLSLAVTVAYASASWFVMERPLINFAARSGRRARG